MMTYIDRSINRIRAYLDVSGVPKSRLASLANVPEGCTRNIHQPDWNPTIETLRKIESVIPSDFETPKKSNKKPKQ